MKIAGSMPCYMNAANEILVGRFLNKEIHWKDIGEKLESLMNKHSTIKACDINTLLELDQEARKEAQQV